MKTYFVLLTMIVGICGSVDAFADCSNHKSCFAFQDLVQQISEKTDNRFDYNDYKLPQNNMFKRNLTQGQVHSLVGATGAFYCGGFGGTANLVMRDNLLLLNAHQFLKTDLGGQRCLGQFSDAELSKCQFRTIDGNGEMNGQPYLIDLSSLRMGGKCDSPGAIGPDWAVVELKEHVAGGNYYDVLNAETIATPNDDYEGLRGTKVVVASAVNSDFKKNGVLTDVPTICEGQLDYFYREEGVTGQFQYRQSTGCWSGHGNSGGGLVVPRGVHRPAIIGIHSTSQGDLRSRGFNSSNFSGGPLIEGELARVLKACEKKCPPLSKSVSN